MCGYSMNRRLDGSLTIELSLLMPFILAVFIFILFSGFFLHDKCIVDKMCLSAALRASEELEDDRSLEKAHAVMDTISDRFLGSWNMDTQISVQESEIKVEFDGDMLMAGGLLRYILEDGDTSYAYECTAYRLNEAKYIKSNKN